MTLARIFKHALTAWSWMLPLSTLPSLAQPPAGPGMPRELEQHAGDLYLRFQVRTNGVRLLNLADAAAKQELLASNAPPLFSLVLRRAGGTEERRLHGDSGWRRVSSQVSDEALSLMWDDAGGELDGISATAIATADPASQAVHWSFRVRNQSTNWSVWRVSFPQVALRDLGPGAEVFFPRGPGEAQSGAWSRPYRYHGEYPGGWCAMQFMAAYQAADNATGLYLGAHDPWGSTKELNLESDPGARAVRFAFDHPAPDMGRAGNDFELNGQAVWQLLRGNWFDAAQIYKNWVRHNARWWPSLAAQGRSDTPFWMRSLNVWALGGGASAECVPGLVEFQRYFGAAGRPVGFHWYNWHEIPFDNDYPHYFPAKPGFRQGAAQLRESGVRVMPYINGRLWDTCDRGADDFEFTRVALGAASKQQTGSPHVESYGSKETNGQPVRLAVMCPATPLWQEKVRATVRRLLAEEGASAVYIDQIAAAPPTLCMDASHGHPLGGGHWWNEGYWRMLDGIRRDMPRDTVLTTECNGEPFVRWLDGYLTWHWQYDGQVPAFPAVYGGAIQMFGRAYRGGASKDLALRMKAGQQLVFGEQIGWIDPGIIKEPSNADFMKRVALMRSRFAECFYSGEMLRPPRVHGPVPKVKADWQWSGEWWVTTDAVLTGAWRVPPSKRLLLLFVNVSDQSVRFKPRFDLSKHGFEGPASEWLVSNPGRGLEPGGSPIPPFGSEIELGPEQLLALRW